MRDVIYFLHSAYVHSTASAMRSFRHLRNETLVRFDLGPNRWRCGEALGGANLQLLLQAAAGYFGIEDIDAKLDLIFEQIKDGESPDVEDGKRAPN